MRRVYGSRSTMQRCTDLGCPSLSRRDRSTHCPRHGGDGELEVACCLRQARGSRRRQAQHGHAATEAHAHRWAPLPGGLQRAGLSLAQRAGVEQSAPRLRAPAGQEAGCALDHVSLQPLFQRAQRRQ